MFVWVCNLQFVRLLSTHFYNCSSQLSMSKCEINFRQLLNFCVGELNCRTEARLECFKMVNKLVNYKIINQ